MKRFRIALCTFLIIALITLFIGCESSVKTSDDYLRIHIRANSNSDADQAVKLKVRDEIVEYLTPLLADKKTVSNAKRTVEKNKGQIVAIADSVLVRNGFSYQSECKITRENFPTRRYGDITLESGEYDAVILNLGDGKGDNWWCVAFPPLCFVGEGEGEVEYKSIIVEWLKNRR